VLLKQQPRSYGPTPGYGNSYGYTAEYRNPNSEKRIEGDIIVKNDLQGARSPAVFRENIWPDAKIPYVISNDEYGILANITVQFLIYSIQIKDLYLDQNERKIIVNALHAFHEKTCVRFNPRTNEADFVSISKANRG